MDTENPPPTETPKDTVPARSLPIFRKLRWLLMIPATLMLVGILVVLENYRGNASLPSDSTNLVTLAVAPVTRQDLYNEVTIPAEFRPYNEVELHAKVSGYLDKVNVDIGDKVKAGELLATLEVPELQDQLHMALATLAKSEADYTNAHLNCQRLETINREKPKLVAQQDLDTAHAKDASAAAAVAAAKADAERYQTLVKYTRIVAPFDGVVTHRYADPGALIQAGTASDTQSLPVVRLSDNYRLRLDFYVSVSEVKDVHPGDTVQVRVDSMAGKIFTGTISRLTEKVESSTRKMMTEIEVPNPSLELVPGMYATVLLKLDRHANALAVPLAAVSSGGKPAVFVVDSNQQMQERTVTLGLETPADFEVVDGLKEGELVVVGSHTGAQVGQKVLARIARNETAANR